MRHIHNIQCNILILKQLTVKAYRTGYTKISKITWLASLTLTVVGKYQYRVSVCEWIILSPNNEYVSPLEDGIYCEKVIYLQPVYIKTIVIT